MSLFQWSEAYGVGHSAIDSQHKRLFQLADDLAAAMLNGRGKEVLSETLEDLIDYTKKHFANEERLMQTHHYPEYPQHKVEHDRLTAKVAAFQKDFAAGRVAITVELMNFLKNWLSHHIGVIDKKVGAYLAEHAS
jgi:hemerythrin